MFPGWQTAGAVASTAKHDELKYHLVIMLTSQLVANELSAGSAHMANTAKCCS